MPIRVACSQCQKAFSAPDNYAGKNVKCPGCGHAISIPGPSSEPSLSDLLDDMVPVASPRYEAPSAAQTFETRPLAPAKSRRKTSSGTGKSILGILGGVFGSIVGFGVVAFVLRSGILPSFGESPVKRYQQMADSAVAVFDSLLDEHMKIQTVADAQAAAPRITEKWNEFFKLAEEEKTFINKRYRVSDITKMKEISKLAEQRIKSTAERLGLRIGMLSLQGEVGRVVIAAIPDGISQWSPDFMRLKAQVASAPPIANSSPALPAPAIPPPVNPAFPPVANNIPTPPQIPQSPDFPRPEFPQPQNPLPQNFPRPEFPKPDSPRRVAENDLERKTRSALLWKQSGKAADFIRANLLTKDDRSLVDELKWSPALKRPVLNLYWGFSIEPIGIPASIHNPSPNSDSRRLDIGLAKHARPVRSSLPTQNFIHMEMERVLGPMLDRLLDGMQQRVNDGMFGVWQTGNARIESGLGLTGVSLIPACSLDQQMRVAREQGMDALLVARVEVKPTVAKRASGAKLKLLLIDPQSQKTIWESEPLDSNVALDETKGAETTDAFADAMFAKVDELFAVKELPTVKASVVPKQVAKLADAKPEMALCSLVEIRYYVCKELLDLETAKSSYAKLLGAAPAELLASESADDRRQAVTHLLEDH